MSRKGNCLDNSPMENFFGRMKNEMFYDHEYEFISIEHLIQEVENYIYYYNNERIQVKLKGLTPVQYGINPYDLINIFLSKYMGSLQREIHGWTSLIAQTEGPICIAADQQICGDPIHQGECDHQRSKQPDIHPQIDEGEADEIGDGHHDAIGAALGFRCFIVWLQQIVTGQKVNGKQDAGTDDTDDDHQTGPQTRKDHR